MALMTDDISSITGITWPLIKRVLGDVGMTYAPRVLDWVYSKIKPWTIA